jgi:Berberine and berberine like
VSSTPIPVGAEYRNDGFPPATYGKNDRLAEIKKRYDPANFFRVNQNITQKPKMEGLGSVR